MQNAHEVMFTEAEVLLEGDLRPVSHALPGTGHVLADARQEQKGPGHSHCGSQEESSAGEIPSCVGVLREGGVPPGSSPLRHQTNYLE